ncbi:hypothetical protein ABZ618_01125 [Streptomyces roseolus]|uniref:hypothetical protein n=1 Tax=Streptomyces roseolus TaxID=67358 RepID=UPI0033ED2795
MLREAVVTWTTVKGRSRLVRLRRDDVDALLPGLLDSVLGGARRTRPAAEGWDPASHSRRTGGRGRSACLLRPGR